MDPENTNLKSSLKTSEFTDAVLKLEPRLAVFDCDGTLWSGDAGLGFFEWELTRGMVSDETVRRARARYAEYLAGKVSEDDLRTVRAAGFTDANIVEIIALSAQFLLTNFVNNAFDTEIDFPVVETEIA